MISSEDSQDIEDISTSEFISTIQSNTSLWKRDPYVSDYVKQQKWGQIAETFKTSVDEVKKRWSLLRDGFALQLQKVPKNENQYTVDPALYPSQWPYYQEMMFLVSVDQIETIENRSLSKKRKMEEESDDIQIEDKAADQEEIIENDLSNSPAKKVFKLNEANDLNVESNQPIDLNLEKNKQIEMTANDGPTHGNTDPMFMLYDDMNFFISLNPILSQMNALQKIRVRARGADFRLGRGGLI